LGARAIAGIGVLMPSKNNFDLLRLLFASIVCVVHAHQLSGMSDLAWVTRALSSAVAVKAFFVVSGYLIFMSYDRSSSIWSYAQKRVRRIYPAYFTVVILCALGFAFVSQNSWSEYFSGAWFKYVAANLVFLNFLKQDLPGVFDANKLQAVNGALWTLKIEVMFYLSVPLFAYVFKRVGRLRSLALLYLLSILYAFFCSQLAEISGRPLYEELGRQLPGQLCYFMAGAFYYFYASELKLHMLKLAFGALAVLGINFVYAVPVLAPFALATLVVFASTYRPLGNFGKYGDFSYGVYILHFPIIQLLIQQGVLQDSPWLFLLMVLCLTGVGAVAMWHLVEKSFLSRGSHYVFTSSK
jgi:peptidoglycan/LPS O-acetylase OafA/YrhL